MRQHRAVFAVPAILVALAVLSCDEGPGVDTLSPAAVSDLSIESVGTTYVDLIWTATGDDGSSGRAAEYHIRYSGSPINGSNWDNAGRCDNVPEPAPAGESQTYRVEPLTPKTTYYFAIRVRDDAGNWSDLSNVASAVAASQDSIGPSPITDLAAEPVDQTSVRLTWTATGDDSSSGTASAYDVRYSETAIDDQTFGSATGYEDEPAPAQDASPEILTVNDLNPATRYFFAIKVVDDAANWSGLSNIASAETPAWPDTIAPGAVNDLASTGSGTTSVDLIWTAPGDDGNQGTAREYDLRYSATPIDETTWSAASPCTDEPQPQPPGSIETYTAGDLLPATTYHFAIKVADEAPNWSDLSNSLQVATQGSSADTVPPAAINDLEAAILDAFTAHLRWTSTGDDGYEGTAFEYDVRFATSPIDSAGWGAASQVQNEPGPEVAGTRQSDQVRGLAAGTRYYFAVRVRDEVSNWSGISNLDSILSPSCEYGIASGGFGIQAYSSTPNSIWVQWEEYKGDLFPPTVFQIRYSTSPIDDWNWDQAHVSPGQPDREDVGNHWMYFTYRIEGLMPATTYYVGVRGVDGDCTGPLATDNATTAPAK